jgi:hypothetical protein
VNWLVLAGVLVTFVTAVIGLWQTLQNQRKIAEVHVLVNSQLKRVLNRVDQLRGALQDADVDVPDPPAL